MVPGSNATVEDHVLQQSENSFNKKSALGEGEGRESGKKKEGKCPRRSEETRESEGGMYLAGIVV